MIALIVWSCAVHENRKEVCIAGAVNLYERMSLKDVYARMYVQLCASGGVATTVYAKVYVRWWCTLHVSACVQEKCVHGVDVLRAAALVDETIREYNQSDTGVIVRNTGHDNGIVCQDFYFVHRQCEFP